MTSEKSRFDPAYFFLWAYLKNSVYLNEPTTVDELKTKIEAQIHNIDKNTCKLVFQNMIRRLDVYQAIGEGSSNLTYDYKNCLIENNFLIKFQNFFRKHFLVTLYNGYIWLTTLPPARKSYLFSAVAIFF